jgi:outer membrane lipoprotein-sorting protein
LTTNPLKIPILLILLMGWAGEGCAVRTHKVKEFERPKSAQTATLEELLNRINAEAEVIQSFQAKVRFDLRSGSLASGELKNYHEIKGFLLYRSPDHLRMIGQIPSFGLNALDMVSDGREFRVSFAPYKKFIIGNALDQPRSKKPLENLRPEHILQAIRPVTVAQTRDGPLLFREEVSEGRENYYVIYQVTRSDSGSATLRRKVWIDRFDLRIARQQLYSEDGVLESDTHYEKYSQWGNVWYPSGIDLLRPREDYGLAIRIEEMKINLPLDDSKFELVRPEGYELIEVGKKPATP